MSLSDPNQDSRNPPRKSLRREITSILVIKLAIILLAALTLFGTSHRLQVNMDVMANHLF